MNKLSDVNSQIEVFQEEIFGYGKPNPIKNLHWGRYEEVLDLTNEVVGVAFLRDEKKDLTKPKLHLIHQTQADFFKELRHENMRGYLAVKRYPGWISSDYEKLYNLSAGDFNGAFEIAKCVIQRLKPKDEIGKIWQVCGPINHGEKGKKQNIKILVESIFQLGRLAKVFCQIPFIPVFDEWEKELKWKPQDTVVVNRLFKPLFESELVNVLGFVEGFNDSLGAIEEHESGMKLEKMEVFHLCKNFHQGEKVDGKRMKAVKVLLNTGKELVLE